MEDAVQVKKGRYKTEQCLQTEDSAAVWHGTGHTSHTYRLQYSINMFHLEKLY